jgi:tRNA(fMet)-specific endonuclease VapC
MVASVLPAVIVDTDVFSYWVKKDPRGELFLPYAREKTLLLTFITIGELYFWAIKKNWGTYLTQQLEKQIAEYGVLPYDYSVCQNYAITRNQQERKGEIVNQADY